MSRPLRNSSRRYGGGSTRSPELRGGVGQPVPPRESRAGGLGSCWSLRAGGGRNPAGRVGRREGPRYSSDSPRWGPRVWPCSRGSRRARGPGPRARPHCQGFLYAPRRRRDLHRRGGPAPGPRQWGGIRRKSGRLALGASLATTWARPAEWAHRTSRLDSQVSRESWRTAPSGCSCSTSRAADDGRRIRRAGRGAREMGNTSWCGAPGGQRRTPRGASHTGSMLATMSRSCDLREPA